MPPTTAPASMIQAHPSFMKILLNFSRKLWSKIASWTGRDRSWQELEYFDESWKRRIEEMAKFIFPGESVVDLGCGRMWLKPLLRDNEYHPVDYTRRDATTVVANFNRHEYPDIVADVSFVSGTLEYIEDYEWFTKEICSRSKKCIVSYCTTECFPDLKVRSRKAWKSHLSRTTLIGLFIKYGMELAAESDVVTQNPIFVFSQRSAVGAADPQTR